MGAGELVTPTLRLVRQLGKGGMGSVWLAENLALRTTVAVKFMSRELAATEEGRMRFAREAAAASQVRSPHVVQMFDHGLTREGVPFIVMELLEGEDLGARVRRLGAPSPTEIATMISQAAKALSRAHERGIVHRDIKPDNLFLCQGDDDEIFVKVIDFGIAKVADGVASTTRTGAMMGTAYYMSPEQMMGSREVDHRTDVWALGVVVYELLTGRLPFDGETIGALALAIHTATPTPVRALRPDLPSEIDVFIERSLARDLAVRFGSVKEQARALSATLARVDVSATGAIRAPGAQLASLAMTTHGRSASEMAPRASSLGRTSPAIFPVAVVAVLAVIAAAFVIAFVVRLRNDDVRATADIGGATMPPPHPPSPEKPKKTEDTHPTDAGAIPPPPIVAAPPKPSPIAKPVVTSAPWPSTATSASVSIGKPSNTKSTHEPVLF